MITQPSLHTMRLAWIQIPMITVATGVPTAGVAQVSAESWPPHITAGGSGEAYVSPDRAVIQVGVDVQDSSAAAAASANAVLVSAIMDALTEMGFSAESLPTVAYSVSPIYDRTGGARALTGYSAHTSIRITIYELNRVGEILDATLAAGANGIPYIQFQASDERAARRTALTMAVARARADAAVLAEAGGGTLGRLIELSTGVVQAAP
ncbi:MAG: SIMPL domain-containing protein [Gemmatimonadota bacterium]|nr:MAG: SIMPL domain-containing protein [Gemmatimonadota bacterium]